MTGLKTGSIFDKAVHQDTDWVKDFMFELNLDAPTAAIRPWLRPWRHCATVFPYTRPSTWGLSSRFCCGAPTIPDLRLIFPSEFDGVADEVLKQPGQLKFMTSHHG